MSISSSSDTENGESLAKEIKQQPTDDQPPRVSPPGLPGELRNTIYRLAIVQPGRVEIDAANPVPPQPGLLRTCRQLREETLTIFYRENSFDYVVIDLRPPIRPDYHRARVSRHVMQFVGSITGTHVFKWENLRWWLKNFHCRKAPTCPPGHHEISVKALQGAFDIVRNLRTSEKLAWEEIEPMLEAWKESVPMVGDAITWT